MKFFAMITALMFSVQAFAITFEEAQTIACQEAARVNFQFETSCEDDFYKPEQVSEQFYMFLGLDISGDCGIRVAVDRQTGTASSKVSCY